MQKAVFYGSMATVLTQARQPTNLKITKKTTPLLIFPLYATKTKLNTVNYNSSLALKNQCNATTMRIVKLENSQEVTYLK